METVRIMKKLNYKWFKLFFTIKQEPQPFDGENLSLNLSIVPKTNNLLLLGIYYIGDKILSYGRA